MVLRVDRKILARPTSRQIELSNFFSLSYFPRRPHRHRSIIRPLVDAMGRELKRRLLTDRVRPSNS